MYSSSKYKNGNASKIVYKFRFVHEGAETDYMYTTTVSEV